MLWLGYIKTGSCGEKLSAKGKELVERNWTPDIVRDRLRIFLEEVARLDPSVAALSEFK